MNIEQDVTDVLVNQLEITRQSIEDRDKRIYELQTRVELLEQLLNRAVAQQSGVPAPQAQPAFKSLPRRWTVR